MSAQCPCNGSADNGPSGYRAKRIRPPIPAQAISRSGERALLGQRHFEDAAGTLAGSKDRPRCTADRPFEETPNDCLGVGSALPARQAVGAEAALSFASQRTGKAFPRSSRCSGDLKYTAI
jgi:hypothetical protein